MDTTSDEFRAYQPSRLFGWTVFCGEHEHEKCKGTRYFNDEPWGPCTCPCHGQERAPAEGSD